MLCMLQAEVNLQVCIFYLLYVSTREQTEVVKFGSKCLKHVSDFTGHYFSYKNILVCEYVTYICHSPTVVIIG